MTGLFMLLVLSSTACNGQRDVKSFMYRLHKPRDHGQLSTLHSMPDGALLTVTKRVEQPKQIWNLLRIAAWDTAQPREDKLNVDVGPNNELLGWLHQEDRNDRDDQLLMDPGGNYLVVRLSQDADTWNTNPGESATPRTVLNIIDLHDFRLLRRVAITDPLLGGGDMGFSPKGAFIVSGLQEKSSATIGSNVTYTNRYAVETLTLPDLKPEMVCRYTIVNRRFPQASSTPGESRRIQEENREEDDRQQDQHQAAETACGSKLPPLGFSSLDDVYKNFNSFGRGIYNADRSQNVPPLSPWDCEFEDLSGDLKYALFDCDESHVKLTFFTGYRGFRVYRLQDGNQIMDLKVPHSPWFSGVLATGRGGTYMVLLRDGAGLEGYRLP